MIKEKRLKFSESFDDDCYIIQNIKTSEVLGFINKRRLGAYLHWVFEPDEDTFFSAGCIDEIREFMRNPKKYKRRFPEVVQ